MTDRPTVGSAAEELYASLAPAFTEGLDPDWHLLTFSGALGGLLDRLWTVVHGGEVPWYVVFDPDAAPDWALGWLAGLAGVRTQPNWTPDETRMALKVRSARQRGTPAAIIAAAQSALTGDKQVQMTERDGGDAYHLKIRTFAGETPRASKVLNAIFTQKPAGILLDYDTIGGQTFADLDAAEPSFTQMDVDYDTFFDVRAA